uniref:Uncharacterized protein n=1 Tax=Pipistrellus kuhlii TaxID=59472 RepID=A0A7J7SMS1_PIPKU|nr:hypothetical protein mPipKuh1_009805 [Pipistrellus kuhlii]
MPHPAANKRRTFGEPEPTEARMQANPPPRTPLPALTSAPHFAPKTNSQRERGFWLRVREPGATGAVGKAEAAQRPRRHSRGGPSSQARSASASQAPSRLAPELPWVAPPPSILSRPDPSGCLGN